MTCISKYWIGWFTIFICFFSFFLIKPACAQEAKLILPIGHTSALTSVCFSPDGKLILTTADDHTAKIWQASTKKLIATLSDHKLWVQYAAFSKDGSMIVTCSSDSTAMLWSSSTGAFINAFKGHNGSVYAASISSNNQYLITGSKDKSLRLWDIRSAKLIHSFPLFENIVRKVYFSDDDKTIICSTKRDLTVWDAGTYLKLNSITFEGKLDSELSPPLYYISNNKYFTQLKGDSLKISKTIDGSAVRTMKIQEPDHNFRCMDISKDGSKLVITGLGHLDLYDLQSGIKTASVKVDPGLCSDVKFSNDGSYLVQCVNSKAIIYQSSDGKIIDSLNGQSKILISGSLSRKGDKFVLYAVDKVPRLVDAKTGKLLYNFPKVAADDFSSEIRFTPDGNYLTIVYGDIVDIYDCLTYKLYAHLKVDGLVKQAIFNPRLNILTTASSEGLRVWNVSDSHLIRNIKFEGGIKSEEEPRFDSEGKQVVISQGSACFVYNISTGSLVRQFSVDDDAEIRYVNFSPDGTKIIVVNGAGKLQVLDIRSGNLENQIVINLMFDRQFQLSFDNRILFFLGRVGSRCIELKTGKEIQISTIPQSIQSIDYNSDGTLVLTTLVDHTCKLWNNITGKQIYTYIPINNEDYLVTDSAGHYDGTRRARDLLYYVCESEIVTLEQLRELSYEPGLAAKLSGVDPNPIKSFAINELSICGLTPLVEPLLSNDNNYNFRIKERKGGVGQVLLWVNGQNIRTYDRNGLKKNGDYFYLTVYFSEIKNRLYADRDNTIDLRAYAEKVRIISKSDPLLVMAPKVKLDKIKHHLYCISVGITKYKGDKLNTLNYASQDAADIEEVVSQAAKKLLDTSENNSNVTSYLLNTPNVAPVGAKQFLPYRANIRQVFAEVASKATADDIIVVFLSGHGVQHSDRQFYYLTADASAFELDGVESSSGIGTDTLLKWMVNIPANKKVLILDACYSGQAVESLHIKKEIPADQQRSLDNLNARTGTYILSASASGHSAFEMSEYGQGILAYNLLLGIKTGGGLRDNRFLDVSTWFKFAAEKVDEMAKENGERQEPKTFGNGDAAGIDVGMIDASVLDKIVLSSKKPVFGKSIVIDTDITDDDLGIGELIEDQLVKLSFQGKSSKLVFISNSHGTDTFKLNCQYKKNGETIKGKIVLVKNNRLYTERSINTIRENLKQEIIKIVNEVTEVLD